MENQLSTKDFFARDGVKNKFQELLGKKSTGFITSVLQVVNSNNLLQKASAESIYNCAAMAATLDLPINQNLGFAWIVPYGQLAQFQMGWRGYLQLAQRTGQYQAINVVEVYENQFKSFNRLSEFLDADFTVEGSGKVVGFVAYFRLINGFEKTSFWTISEVEEHGKKFSKTYNSPHGVWKSNFNAMAKKTVLKNTLSKWGILSIEMQQAVQVDSSVINDVETLDVDYVDNGTSNPEPTKKEFTSEMITQAIESGATLESIKTMMTVSDEVELEFEKALSEKTA